MGYRIVYEPEKADRYPGTERRNQGLGKLLALGLVCIFAAVLVFSGGWDDLKALLLPGDPECTARAAQTLSEELKQGEPLWDALSAFCVEIVDNANQIS